VLRLSKLNKFYRIATHSLHVLRDVDLEIAEGEMVAIMGASGSGKSTLLNILGILDDYDSGEYWIGDTLIKGLTERKAANYRNRFIGFVFQSFNLLPFKTALENVALPLYYQGVTRRKRNTIAMQYLDRVGLKAAQRRHSRLGKTGRGTDAQRTGDQFQEGPTSGFISRPRTRSRSTMARKILAIRSAFSTTSLMPGRRWRIVCAS